MVDTAAEVTIISDTFYNKLSQKPEKKQDIKLRTAGRDLHMSSFATHPLQLQLGSKTYSIPVVVGPIQDDVLLGLDFFVPQGAHLDLTQQLLQIGSDTIEMTLCRSQKVPQVSRITVWKKTIIPPNSVQQLECPIPKQLSDFIIEPRLTSNDLLMPRTYQTGGSVPIVCLVNPSDHQVVLQPRQVLGVAMEIHHVESPSEQSAAVRSGNQPNIPAHLTSLFERSSELLQGHEVHQLAQLHTDYQDVFAKDDLDLGNFTELEHSTDTGNAKPIKQRMRRTPLGFEKEEETHLKKMLDA
ncbi:uncharacterized protein [Haliotis cracherodii]|uniref:uncharacterized protein n=1 Tax=Haliotis cracherodii TaxID=6455 RepID=UPI0039ECFC89